MTVPPTLDVVVAHRRDEAEGICSFELRATDGSPLPPFSAGSHVDVHVPGGPVRPYSLCNDPAETHRYLIAVQREPASRGGSAGMHDAVHAGDRLTIGLPRNAFALHPHARTHLLLAGGIGLTPLLAMAEQLHHDGARFELHLSARSRARVPMAGRLASAPWAGQVRLHLDDGDAGQRLELAPLLAAPDPGRHLYVCGPQGYIDAVLGAARSAGWAPAQLHHESFTPVAPIAGADAGFTVRLLRAGRDVPVAAGQRVTDALADAGVVVPTSCEQGICGTCLTRVVDGRPDHRDQYLTPEEQAAGDQFTPCCSRSHSPLLVLDL